MEKESNRNKIILSVILIILCILIYFVIYITKGEENIGHYDLYEFLNPIALCVLNILILNLFRKCKNELHRRDKIKIIQSITLIMVIVELLLIIPSAIAISNIHTEMKMMITNTSNTTYIDPGGGAEEVIYPPRLAIICYIINIIISVIGEITISIEIIKNLKKSAKKKEE